MHVDLTDEDVRSLVEGDPASPTFLGWIAEGRTGEVEPVLESVSLDGVLYRLSDEAEVEDYRHAFDAAANRLREEHRREFHAGAHCDCID